MSHTETLPLESTAATQNPEAQMTPLRVRAAVPADVPRLHACWQALTQELESAGEQPFAGRSDQYSAMLLDTIFSSIDNPDAHILVAESSQSIIGTVAAYMHHRRDVQLSPVGVLYSLWITPEHRRYGIGSLLYEHISDWVRERGGRALQVAWRSDNSVSEAFWQSKQFDAFECIAHRKL